MRPTFIRQPGPPHALRLIGVPARTRHVSLTLEAGQPLLKTIETALAGHGAHSAVLALSGGAVGPFSYVMPSLPVDEAHAAFYSGLFSPAGVTKLEAASMTVGLRDGLPFFHCHGLWREADGRRSGGHILPDATVIAEPIQATATLIEGAAFVAEYDRETNFTLFGPVRAGTRPSANGYAIRILPNEDLCLALERFAGERGITGATLHGGVGSIVGAHFEDGRIAERFATEMFMTAGRITTGADGPRASVDVSLIDCDGMIHSGRLVRGDNPVLMTVELVMCVDHLA